MINALFNFFELINDSIVEPLMTAIQNTWLQEFFTSVNKLLNNIFRLINNDNYLLVEDYDFTTFIAGVVGFIIIIILFKLVYNVFVYVLNAMRGLSDNMIGGLNETNKTKYKKRK